MRIALFSLSAMLAMGFGLMLVSASHADELFTKNLDLNTGALVVVSFDEARLPDLNLSEIDRFARFDEATDQHRILAVIAPSVQTSYPIVAMVTRRVHWGS